MKRVLTLFVFLVFSICSYSQTRVVPGKVTAFNRYPIVNMKVIAKKSKATVTTDSLGCFNIVCKEKDRIIFKANGFYPVSKSVSGNDSVIVNMILKEGKKNEEVAVGYGYIKKDDLAYAVSHLSDENDVFITYSDIFSLIEERFIGVRVDKSSNPVKIYMRGVTSINLDASALFVVDGVVSYDISNICPSEIKTIDIIKDGGAAIYGSRGAGGVVVITLKK